MISNKTKSKMFFWTVIICILETIIIFFMARYFLNKHISESALNNASTSSAVFSYENIDLDADSNRLYARNNDSKVYFTIDPEMQLLSEELMIKYDPVIGVFVAIEPETGKVLVMSVYSRKSSATIINYPYSSFIDPISRTSTYPMASISKLITASAAIRNNLYNSRDVFDCDGRLELEDGSVSDPTGVHHGRITMSDALAKSCNTTFGKIALKVGRENLLNEFHNFGFNSEIPFDLPVTESRAFFSEGKLSLARAGAGFHGANISPLHAAMIAASIANKGIMMKPYIIDSIASDEKSLYSSTKQKLFEPINKNIAGVIEKMMNSTVNKKGCTAYRGFYINNKYIAGNTRIVGKTGSISGNNSLEHYAWFVGHVTSGNPDIAFAAMIVNDDKWKIKAASYTGQFFQGVSGLQNK